MYILNELTFKPKSPISPQAVADEDGAVDADVEVRLSCGTEVGMIVGAALVKFEEPEPEPGVVAVELSWLIVPELETLVTKEPPLGSTVVVFDWGKVCEGLDVAVSKADEPVEYACPLTEVVSWESVEVAFG